MVDNIFELINRGLDQLENIGESSDIVDVVLIGKSEILIIIEDNEFLINVSKLK